MRWQFRALLLLIGACGLESMKQLQLYWFLGGWRWRDGNFSLVLAALDLRCGQWLARRNWGSRNLLTFNFIVLGFEGHLDHFTRICVATKTFFKEKKRRGEGGRTLDSSSSLWASHASGALLREEVAWNAGYLIRVFFFQYCDYTVLTTTWIVRYRVVTREGQVADGDVKAAEGKMYPC